MEGLQQRIILELGIPSYRQLQLTHRLKVLSAGLTLKQEQLESGEIVDVMVRLNDSPFTSAYSEAPMADSVNPEYSPAYSA